MAKNYAGRDIWYERNFLRWTPITTEGFFHLFLSVSVGLALGFGGDWLAEQPQPALQLLGGAAWIAFPIWIVANMVVAVRHSGPRVSSR